MSDKIEELVARLKAHTIIKRGEKIMVDIGNGPVEVSTGDVVRQHNPDGPEAAQLISELRDRVELLEGLISERSIEAMAKDIACAVIAPWSQTVEARHSAMVRLGERLRKQLSIDEQRARSSLSDGGNR